MDSLFNQSHKKTISVQDRNLNLAMTHETSQKTNVHKFDFDQELEVEITVKYL